MIDIYCLNLYLENENEYDEYLELFEEFNVKVFSDKKEYNFESNAAGSMNNGLYFTEGINKMFKLSKGREKVLMLDEDSFFTSGETIKFLLENDFDFAVRLTKEAGVTTIPVSAFYQKGKDDKVLRLCFSKKNETLEQAVERLVKL